MSRVCLILSRILLKRRASKLLILSWTLPYKVSHIFYHIFWIKDIWEKKLDQWVKWLHFHNIPSLFSGKWKLVTSSFSSLEKSKLFEISKFLRVDICTVLLNWHQVSNYANPSRFYLWDLQYFLFLKWICTSFQFQEVFQSASLDFFYQSCLN